VTWTTLSRSKGQSSTCRGGAYCGDLPHSLFVTNGRGAVCCYDLTISLREEARRKAMTSNSLSTNSPACPRNVFPRIVHSPRIGMPAKRFVSELERRALSCPRIVCPQIGMSAKRFVRELERRALSCPQIVCPQIGMSAKSPVTEYMWARG